MMSIDKQRIEAVRTLEGLGYAFAGDKWRRADCDTSTSALVPAEADALHALLVLRADALMGCTEGSPEEEELSNITDAIEAYEAKRSLKEKSRAARVDLDALRILPVDS